MLKQTVCVCLFLALLGAGSSLTCRWMSEKFRQHSRTSWTLLDTMGNNSTNTTEEAELDESLVFPGTLYDQASRAPDQDKLAFIVQVLKEVSGLFEEDYSAASWEESTVEDFLNVVNQQADGLGACIGRRGRKKSAKLQLYFKRLSELVLKKKELSAEAWELIRTEIQQHFTRVDLLASPLTIN